MRHRKVGKKLSRKTGPRKALMRDLATELIVHEKISTTLAKAKALRPIVEKIITKGKKETLAARRDIMGSVRSAKASDKVMKDLAPRYKTRKGGYTRITKTGPRQGDGAKTARIEFV
ncbi:MAG: 50S ribosomal protein L17 [Candidatus Jacksonbacteria bacterium]|jgi:large subunit ribosomal protein L17|nr:50S ribosomal protein L17 [Candidatus Jacksonbacteria bacterium]MBT6034324.1 50S ribosomal protein L17 [Candidatus Jacksonbacteria bacterium]MBT6301445.1 50S ribosomal protein L17 [Candidatus Jacksonbacteria bacterium]MBT6757023.1 50S ribosomal protein L17 [Candidatus Jacksonbacteria bacterium]MBT6955516.1 50S ribosomal protein L17 [Candidatus Jacksonbacteria bacterium]